LNSFKQFLEQERRRGRKRLMWGLLGFTVAIAGVLALVIQMNRAQDLALKTDIQRTSTRLDRSRLAAEAELKKVADKAAQSVANNAATIRTDITRNILWAHSALASNMNSELSGRDNEIERLKEKVATLEVDNTMLARQVAELVQRVKIIEQDYLDNIERSVTESQISMMPELATGAVSNPAPVVERSPSLMINSAKFGRTMQMRVPKE
jgi:cell division protein FtsL